MSSEVLEQKLSRKELQDLKNKRSGLAIFQLSWILVFVCLVIVNWQLRTAQPSWPPQGVQAPAVALPTLATIGLLVSVWLVRRAARALTNDRRDAFFSHWRAALVLGSVFIGVMLYEFFSIPYSAIYSDVFRMMTGFHGVHALAIVVFMGMIYRRARAGAYSPADFWPVEGAAGLWYFVVFAWILFYVVLYLL